MIIHLLSIGLSFTHAIVCPPRNSLIEHGRGVIKKVTIFDGIQPMGAKTFAEQNGLTEAQAEARYAATGVFVCDDAAGNGHVVTKGNMIVTVFHTLLKDRRSCDKPRKIKGCAFVLRDGSKSIRINAKKIFARGSCRSGEDIPTGEDWAIVELDKSVPKSVVPYKAPDAPGLSPGQQVTLIGRTSAFNPDPSNKDFFKNPQAFSSCVAIGKDTFTYFNDYQSNCPSAAGSSGSAVLTGTGVPTLSGIMSGVMLTEEICTPQVSPMSADGPFEKNCRGSLLVPAEGKFLEALKSIR